MPPKIPRPYIKSSHRLDLHKQHNSGPESRAVLEKLAAFLSAAGFGRVTEEKQTKKKRMMQVDCNVVEELKKEGEATSSSTIVEATAATIHSSATKCNSPKSSITKPSSTSSRLAQLGLRSMLRLLQRSEPPKKKTEDSAKKPTMVLLDADLLGPSAVANIFALFALSSPDVPFFVLPSLSSSLSAALNFPRCSTVTLLQVGNGADSADDEATVQVQQLCQAIRTTLKPIGLTDRKAAKQQQQQRFKVPELAIPVGKAGKKKKKRTKKRNLLL